MTSWWRNMSDIFYILSIPEVFYYHLDTLVTRCCVPRLHVKQTRNGVDKYTRFPSTYVMKIALWLIVRKSKVKEMYTFHTKLFQDLYDITNFLPLDPKCNHVKLGFLLVTQKLIFTEGIKTLRISVYAIGFFFLFNWQILELNQGMNLSTWPFIYEKC